MREASKKSLRLILILLLSVPFLLGQGDDLVELKLKSGKTFYFDSVNEAGKGSEARIFQGEDRRNDLKVAVKIFADRNTYERATERVQLLEKVPYEKRHQWFLNYLDTSVTDNNQEKGIHVYEWAPHSLSQLNFNLPKADATSASSHINDMFNVMSQLTKVNGILNDAGLIHTDLKTDNVFFSRDQSGRIQCILGDLSGLNEISKLYDGKILTTHWYNSKEINFGGGINAASSLTNIGMILATLLGYNEHVIKEAKLDKPQHERETVKNDLDITVRKLRTPKDIADSHALNKRYFRGFIDAQHLELKRKLKGADATTLAKLELIFEFMRASTIENRVRRTEAFEKGILGSVFYIDSYRNGKVSIKPGSESELLRELHAATADRNCVSLNKIRTK